MNWLVYDTILGIAGTALSLTAAFDFKAHHSHVKNMASGNHTHHILLVLSYMDR
jgi:hypothetical protein